LYLQVQCNILAKFVQMVRDAFGLEIDEPVPATPPTLEMGDLSIAACFELAKQLRQPPQKIAEQIAARLMPLAGVERVSIAGGGYLNFHLERGKLAAGLFRLRTHPPEPSVTVGGKIPTRQRTSATCATPYSATPSFACYVSGETRLRSRTTLTTRACRWRTWW